MQRRTKLIIVAAVVIAALAPVAWAVFTLTVKAPITVSVVPVTAAVLTSVALDNVQCPISTDGKSATCPAYAGEMFVGNSFPLVVTAQNTGTISAPVVVNPSSDKPTVVDVTASSTNPTSISAGGSATFRFTVTAKLQGTANIQVTISG